MPNVSSNIKIQRNLNLVIRFIKFGGVDPLYSLYLLEFLVKDQMMVWNRDDEEGLKGEGIFKTKKNDIKKYPH